MTKYERGVFMKGRKLIGFIMAFVFIMQTAGTLAVFAGGTIKITKFTKSPEKPDYTQTVLFRVRTEGDVAKVTLSIDGEKESLFSKKSSNIWQLEKKLSVEGTRYLKVVAVGTNGETDSVTDTMEVVKKSVKKKTETETTETTTRTFTGNVEKTTETTTEQADRNIIGGNDFDGGVYDEEPKADDSYFDLARNEDMEWLEEIAEASVFMFVGEPEFINKWKREPIDPENPGTVSYIKNGYTLVPLRAVSEAFGAEVSWDSDTKTALISFLGKNISVSNGEYSITIDGSKSEIDVCPEINDGRVFVPLRAIAEALNKNVYYVNKFIGITNYNHALSENGLELIRQSILRGTI